MSSHSPIALAERLLEVVKSVYQPEATASSANWRDAYDSKNRIVELCDQLRRNIMGPLEYTVLLAESCQESSALRFVTDLGVADIIGDATMSLSEISKSTGVDIRYLHITMNCLLAHGYFEEVGSFGSHSYRNNAMSHVLRSGHAETLKEAVGFVCDEGFKSTSYLLEAARASAANVKISEQGTRKSTPAVHMAFGFQESIFEWMASPGQAWRGQRMGKAMQQLHRMANGNVVVDFEWNELASPVVDIGGGIGSLEMALLKAYPESALNFVIFDISETVENAIKVWSSQTLAAQAQVSFVSGDFLAPTIEETKIPVSQPTYLIRHVLHDWTDEQVVAILNNVRGAMLAGPSTSCSPKLVLCEMLLQRTSSRFVRTTSVQLLALNNGVTRTEGEMIRLVNEAGFKVTSVHAMRAADSIIEAIPIA